MDRQILVPVDGSDLAEAILPHARQLARATRSGLTLLRALPLSLPDPVVGGVTPYIREADVGEPDLTWFRAAPPADYPRPVPVRIVAQEGAPAAVITRYAAQHPEVWAIAMATHGRAGFPRLVFGSVTEAVLHAVSKPLLLIHPQEDQDSLVLPPVRPYHTIAVPLDGSALAERALVKAQALALATGAGLLLVTAAPEPGDYLDTPGVAGPPWIADEERMQQDRLSVYLAGIQHALGAAGLTVQIHLGHAQPADTILTACEQGGADLIVMSTHGRGGWQRLRLGSVAMEVVRAARRPVLLVRADTPVSVPVAPVAAGMGG